MLAALQALCMALLVPPWMGEDEPWHLESALWVARGELPAAQLVPDGEIPHDRLHGPISHLMIWRRFPTADPAELAALQAALLESMADHRFDQRVDWAPDVRGTTSFDVLLAAMSAAQQPSLYALLLGTWLKPFQGLSLEGQLLAARFPSVLVYLLAVWTALRLGQRLGRGPHLALLAGLVCALWPMHARQAAVVNNDVLAKAVVCFALLLALELTRGSASPWRRLRFVAVLAAAPFAKSTAISALVLAPAVFIRSRRRARNAGREALIALAAVAAVAITGFVGLATSPSLPGGVRQFMERIARSTSPERLEQLGQTFVGMVGWNQRTLPQFTYQLAEVIGAVALLGLSWAALRAGWRLVRRRTPLDATPTPFDRTGAPLVILLSVSVAFVQIAMVTARGETAGRYLFPAIAPFAALVASGWLALAPARYRVHVTALLTALLLALNVSFVILGLVAEEWLRFAA
jgi:4-amino-4-deoxy-L-arabinose transferase-like glycosyltransferase